jgi:acylphosphatase
MNMCQGNGCSNLNFIENQGSSPVAKVRLLIRGRVHGVFFRQSTRERAQELGLVGWVRNLENGMVEVEAEGKRDLVEQLVAWCHKGPPSARVDAAEVTWLETENKLERLGNSETSDFEIR